MTGVVPRFTPADRRRLIQAIGAGRVYRVDGQDWRRTGLAAGANKVQVGSRHLAGLVGEGLAVLDHATGRWQLTLKGHAARGEAS